MPVIETPHVLGQVEGQSVSPDAALRRELALQVPPEPLQAIDVGPPAGGVLALRVVDQPVDIALGGDPRIALLRVRADRRPGADPPADERPEGRGLHVRHDLRPDGAPATPDPENRGLRGTPAPLGGLGPLRLPLVLPLPAHVGLVDLHRAVEDRRHILRHHRPDPQQRPEHPAPFQAGLRGDLSPAQPQEEPAQQPSPFPARQPQREAVPPFVAADRAPRFGPPNRIALFVTASGARPALSHTGILTNLVAGM